MSAFVFHASTFISRTPDNVRAVLECPTVSRLLFPARMYTAPKTGIELSSSADFDVRRIPREFYTSSGSLVNIPLHGENGIDFSATIQLRDTGSANVANLQFSGEHLTKGVLSLSDLKLLLAEVIPAFKAGGASVFDLDRPFVTRPSGGAVAEQRRYTKDPDGRYHAVSLEWISYFGPPVLDLIGRERFDRLRICAEKYEQHGGIVVVLQEEPFDRTNPVHRARLAQAEAELGLAELVSA